MKKSLTAKLVTNMKDNVQQVPDFRLGDAGSDMMASDKELPYSLAASSRRMVSLLVAAALFSGLFTPAPVSQAKVHWIGKTAKVTGTVKKINNASVVTGKSYSYVIQSSKKFKLGYPANTSYDNKKHVYAWKNLEVKFQKQSDLNKCLNKKVTLKGMLASSEEPYLKNAKVVK